MKKTDFWAGCIIGAMTVVASLLFVMFGSVLLGAGGDGMNNFSLNSKMGAINRIIDRYYDEYDENLDSIPMEEGVYKGMVASLGDPYSAYYTKQELDRLNDSVKGEFHGIGVSISANEVEGTFTVVGFTDESAAEKVGVMEGDVFYEVDGVPVQNMDLDTLVGKVRGASGTSVHIVFLRDGKEIPFDIERKSVKANTVSSNMLENDIGYIDISAFEAVTVEQFKSAARSLQDRGMKGLIIDLRGNPGGTFDSAVKISDYILPAGKIVYVRDKAGKEKNYNSDAEQRLDMPIAVLVNGRTASAAEILSGAIKENNVGVLVGTKTYGKGIVQNIFPLSDGSAVKLTSQKYYTPSGNNIQGKGIMPDYEIEFDNDLYLEKNEDNQLDKALEIVSNALNIN